MAPHGAYPPHNAPTISLHYRIPVLAFGILQVLFGVALIITDIINFGINLPGNAFLFSVAGSGIYTGVFFIITGSFGIAAGRPLSVGTTPRSRRCLLVTSMVMSILSTLLATALLILLAVLLAVNVRYEVCYPAFTIADMYLCELYVFRGHVFMGSFLAFQGVMWIFCLGQSIAAGVNMCKLPRSTTTTQVVYVQPGYSYPQGAPGQAIHFVTGQPSGLGGPPVPMGNPPVLKS
ncbi:uncharacterized protein LOC129597121 [Paramacrobiotus metropolitanus]|uniref:uncharacterized protein LOC129597121 n=1 Tax=Paramacrobiotus metropolitanus TaxID=2943436 RepID=UPI0024464828|nr:uncharacterized protein LOC129597121 [Paramacrobiotus metropolitanus]